MGTDTADITDSARLGGTAAAGVVRDVRRLADFGDLMFPSLNHARRQCLASLAAVLLWHTPAWAQVDETQGRALVTEFGLMVNEATAVVGGLQGDINAGSAADKGKTQAMVEAFEARYAKAAGKPFEAKGDGVVGEARKAFATSLKDTLQKFEPTIAKGGQDAFVPAFFRAELLKRFNVQFKGKLQGYATNRDSELINADWSVTKVMKGSPLVSDAAKLVNAGDTTQQFKRAGDRLLAYWPMKLGTACVACHARNGLKQTEGAFGGALIAEVWVK
jgi:hypothetical protein